MVRRNESRALDAPIQNEGFMNEECLETLSRRGASTP